MPSKFQAPDLANATPEFLVDEMGKLSVAMNHAKKMREFYKTALFAKLNIDPKAKLEEQFHAGEVFIAKVGQSATTRLNQTRIKETQAPEWIAEMSDTTDVTRTTFTLAPGAQKPAANELLNQILREMDLEDLEDPYAN